MKQILCITAYKEFSYLKKFCEFASEIGFVIYIHIDLKKSTKQILYELNVLKNVTAFSKYKIPWGGITHVYAVLEMIHMALNEYDDISYLHVITGQDICTKRINEFDLFFNLSNKHNYMSCSVGKNNSFRYQTFYRNDILNYKSKIGNFITKALHVIQKVIGINRKEPFGWNIYKGMLYVSITADFAKYVTEFVSSSDGRIFMKWLRWCFIPEEFFFQTILMNSAFKDTLINNNYRFALWEYKNGSQPGVLDETDYQKIKQTDAFFARKMSEANSKGLVDNILSDII